MRKFLIAAVAVSGLMFSSAVVKAADEKKDDKGWNGVLIDAACEVVPHTWACTFRGVRVGLRPATPDDLPIIGASSRMPNLMYATGHYRNGVLLAPITAKLVADAMLDHTIDPALEALSPARFGL